jgi:hypothetical protein
MFYDYILIFERMPSNIPRTNAIRAIAMIIGRAARTRSRSDGNRLIICVRIGVRVALRSTTVSPPFIINRVATVL